MEPLIDMTRTVAVLVAIEDQIEADRIAAEAAQEAAA
jgi:hypothetical protein